MNGDGAARGDGEERPRDERGRLLSRFPKAHIQRAVREVCLYADPAEPLAVSRPLFDACRAKAGWSNLPTAKQCAARMRLTWEQLKAHALADDLDFTRSDGARDRRTRNMFRPDQVPFALKVVHARLAAKAQVAPGEYRLSASAYDMEVIELEASSANSRGLTLLYPTARQVEDLCELPFEQVCRRLGIAYGAHQERSLEVIEVLDMIVETYDVLPTQAELTAFAKANKLSMKNPKRLRDDFARLRAQRDALGKSTPRSQRADKLRPDFTVPVGEYQGRRAKEAMPGADELLAIGVDFVRWIESNDSPRGARPTAPMWRLFMERRVAEGERRIWEPSLAAHYPGGLSALVADAYDELLSEHQREAEPKPVELRSGSVPGDETFDYDAPLIAHLTSKRTTWMLPICAYVHQHGPCRRVDIGESLGLGPTGLIQNVTRLLNLDALRAVSPEGAEDGRTRDLLILSPTVSGEAFDLVVSHEEIKAPERSDLAKSERDQADDFALSLIPSLLRPDGTFVAERFSEAYGKSRQAGSLRLRGMVARGLLMREDVPPDEREFNERFRYRLAPGVEASRERDAEAA